MAKHRFAEGYKTGALVNLYRNPVDGTITAEPDATHSNVLPLPVQFDGSDAFVEPIVTDDQLTALSGIFID